MFMTQSIEETFNFNIVIEDNQQSTIDVQPFQEQPEELLTKEKGIICYSSRGSHLHNYDQFDFIVKNHFVLAALYDGHGGPTVSLYLKENLLKNIINHPMFYTNPQVSFVQSIKLIEEQILIRCLPTCGSTILIVLWTKNQVYVVSVGDGLCYGFENGLQKQNQKKDVSQLVQNIEKKQIRKVQLNQIHSLDYQHERNSIKNRGGIILKQKNSYRVAGQLNVSRAIGDSKYKKWISATPSVKKYNSNFQYIVLATDGFSKPLESIRYPQQTLNFIQKPIYLKDNSTFILLTKPTETN